MLDLLQKTLTAQLTVSLVIAFVSSLFVYLGTIPPDTWKEIIIAVIYTFVGGGFIKEGLTQFSKSQNSSQ